MSESFSEEEAMDYILKIIKTGGVKVRVKRNKIPEENNRKLYSLLWDTFTNNVEARIKSSTKYQNMENYHNYITILNDMKKLH